MFRIKKSVNKDCTLFIYIFKGTDNVGTYAFLNEVVSIADLVAYRNVLIINLVSSRKQPCPLHDVTDTNMYNKHETSDPRAHPVCRHNCNSQVHLSHKSTQMK